MKLLMVSVFVALCLLASSCTKRYDNAFCEEAWRILYRFELEMKQTAYEYDRIPEEVKRDLRAFLEQQKKYDQTMPYEIIEVLYELYNGGPYGTELTDYERVLDCQGFISIFKADIPTDMKRRGLKLDYEAIRDEVKQEMQDRK